MTSVVFLLGVINARTEIYTNFYDTLKENKLTTTKILGILCT